MPSNPQAFLSFSEDIHFSRSQGLILSEGFVVCSFVQNLDTGLHPPFMVFVTWVVWCEMAF
jgi:hypothetical protein